MAAGRTAAAVLAAARLASGDDGTAAPSVLPTPAPSPLRALGGDDDDGSGGGIKMSSTELLFIPVAVVVVGLLLMMCYLFFQSKPPDGPPEFAKPADEPEEANVLDDEGCHRQTVRTATKDSDKDGAASSAGRRSRRRPYRARQWPRS